MNAFKIISTAITPVSQCIANLTTYCSYGTANTSAIVTSDITNGACRTVVFSTQAGDIKIFACEKDNGYIEIYKQVAPEGIDYKACLANGCIMKDNGFAKFIPTITSTSTTESIHAYKGIASLSISCAYNSVSCKVTSDITSGTCRTVVFSTIDGNAQIQACEKTGGSIEVYRQSYPSNFAFKACMGQGCVDNNGGFAKFLA